MKPIALHLTNFRNYRGTHELLLADIGCAAIVGPNGAGKSGLLDAMAYALFGTDRGNADNVVTLGETSCSVQFAFQIGSESYAVRRIRITSGAGSSELILLRDEADGLQAQPLTGNTISDTQAKIQRITGMDLDLWRRTAYIGQGASGLFSQATPAERKSILGQILGLDRYEGMLETTKARKRVVDADLDAAARRTTDIEAALSMRETFQGDLATAEAMKATADQLLRIEGEKVHELQRLVAEVSGQAAEYQRLCAEATKLLQGKTGMDVEAQEIAERIAGCEQLLARGDEIRDGLTRLEAAKSELAELSEAKVAVAEATRRVENIERGIELDLAQWRADLASSRQTLDGKIARNTAAIEEHLAVYRAVEQQAALTDDVPCAGTDLQPQCRLLQGAMEAKGQLSQRQERIDAARAEMILLKDPHHPDQIAIAELAAKLEDHHPRQAELDDANSALSDAQTCHDPERAAELARMVSELCAAHYPEAAQDLAAADAVMKELTARRTDVERRQTETQEQYDEVRRQATPLREAVNLLQADVLELEDRRTQLDEAQQEASNAAAMVGQAQARLAGLDDLEADKDVIQAESAPRVRRQHVLAELVTAYGRNGIPALLIENAIPEIEEEANRILQTLTAGRMSVQLLTQVQTKTAGIGETLDVVVSDGEGSRDYSTWSGGERVRVDIALRVALCRILARRAGAAVRMLAIDEACAPLDVDGREAFIEAVQGLQQYFDCILVVSHVPDLAGAFPQQINILRNGTGGPLVHVVA
ncbi:MAG: hypothetical protein A2V88_13980 [Elusimicrobia bacterium RBG_16_66_12]|nr:MAG: hypothetical protein A2V88_13980 [Elusimicrobia bacterium RBG_16_66_12]